MSDAFGRAGAGADPITHSRHLHCSADRAFEAFTADLGKWWDPRYTPEPETFDGVDVPPRVGATVALRHGPVRHPIGTVTAFEPGRRYAQTFTLALDPNHPTELTLTFTAEPPGCRVDLSHGGWGPGNRAERSRFTDWPQLLDRFAAFAETGRVS